MSTRVSGGDLDAALLRDERRGLADQRRIRQPLRRHQHARQRLHLRRVHEVAALPLKLAPDVVGNRLVHHDGIFRRAKHAVVEGLAGDDVANGFLHVRGPLDVRRRVARTHAVSRLARAVCRAHQTHPARRQNDGDVAMLHQFVRPFERDGGHPVDGAGWRAGAACRLIHHLGDARDAFHRRRVRAEHDGASRFDGNQDLVDRRRRRVGGRDDGGDDAERLGDFDDALVIVPRDHADRFHRADEVVDLLRAEEVLLDLVGDEPVAGFLDGQPGECFGLARCGLRPSRRRSRRCAPD